MITPPAFRKTFVSLLAAIVGFALFSFCDSENNDAILSFEANPSELEIKMYLNREDGSNYTTLGALKEALSSQGKELLFAMNGGMYTKDLRPLGLYIEQGDVLCQVNKRKNANGNFYLEPNGIFYLTNTLKASVVTTDQFIPADSISYATQSGPMLLINGEYHPAFNEGSSNLNIRNGVGVLPNGNVLFAMSKSPINFYDFATFFKLNGCTNALYLDGFVSRAYHPTQSWEQLSGSIGVIIGICE